MALVGGNYGVCTSVFLFGCEISSKCGKYKLHPKKRIFCYNIFSFFLEKMLNFEKKKLIFLGLHLDSDFYLLAFFKTSFKKLFR
jgi:hypothetical protein